MCGADQISCFLAKNQPNDFLFFSDIETFPLEKNLLLPPIWRITASNAAVLIAFLGFKSAPNPAHTPGPHPVLSIIMHTTVIGKQSSLVLKK